MYSRVCTTLVVILALFVRPSFQNEELEEQMRVLSKQMTALVERRQEDLKSIEENMRRKLTLSQDFLDVREEIRSLKDEIAQLRSGNFQELPPQHQTTQTNNDHVTVKWLTNSVAELKTEVSELQTTVNSTVILQNHEQFDSDLSLLKSDVSNLNDEMKTVRKRQTRCGDEVREIKGVLEEVKKVARETAVVCGKNKNQLKVAQLEWDRKYNWKSPNEPLLVEESKEHPSRHQRLLRKHVVELEKITKHLTGENDHLRNKLLSLEQEMRAMQKYLRPLESNVIEEQISGRDLRQMHPNLDAKVAKIESQQTENTRTLTNLTKQLTNFDKLHVSMLELLENVESIESKVDKNFPEFRKEISKLEIQLSETSSEVAWLKEDQTNTRNSVKAIGVGVSNLQDKLDAHKILVKEINETVQTLKTSNSVQTSKLHDHILKTESSTLDYNTTKSTIHLVQELNSFEHEYKSIVNKLPHDCNSVSGPNGLYIISPGDGEPILASCNDGWTTFQRRYDGSVDFNRNWNEYSNGFGSATGEHWLGNRNLHTLTKSNCTKLQINMKDIYGKYWQANYDYVRVEDYTMGFKLVIDKYHGNASDALDYQNRMEFSTVDNDRDISNTHCASNYEGGWWFSHCQHANLNGRYNLGLTWFDNLRNEWIAVATSEMRVKLRENC